MADEGARAARAADLPRLDELMAQMLAELVPMRGGDLWARRDGRDDLRALLDRADACVVVGTIDDTVIGFAVCELESLRDGTVLARITELFVDPEARAVGVGEAMLGLVLGFAREHRCVGVDALALPGHRAAKNFFETHGFTARAILMHRPGDRP